MIERGESWKFRSHLQETNLYADQVVEHLITGAIAHRRVFTEAATRDDAFLSAVKRQIEDTAEFEHPAFPRVFLCESVHNHFCVIGELVEGNTLSSLTLQKKFSDRVVWAETALKIVRMLEEFEELGLAFDRLTLQTLTIQRDFVRVARRFPVGCLRPGKPPEEPFLKRAYELGEGGAYFAERSYPQAAGMANLKDLLYSMAVGAPDRTVDSVIDAALLQQKQSGKRVLSMLGLDQKTERIILGLHGDDTVSPIRNLGELREALVPMCPDHKAPAIRPGKPKTNRPAMDEEKANKEATPIPVKEAPAPQSENYRGPAAIPMVGKASIDADVEEDRSYLYPGKKPGEEHTPGDEQEPSAAKSSLKTKKTLPIQAILIALGFVALVVIGGAALVMTFSGAFSSQPNQPPIAVIANIPDEVRENEVIRLDASESFDPEGADLRYTWRVLELPETQGDFRFDPSRSSRETGLRIFVAGTYTIELVVYDGALNSEPAQRMITVNPR